MKMIETERLIIRNFQPEDWQDLQEYLSRAEVLRFEPHWNCSTESCMNAARQFTTKDDLLAVELKGGEFMTWDLGYIFNPAYSGNGMPPKLAERFCNMALII